MRKSVLHLICNKMEWEKNLGLGVPSNAVFFFFLPCREMMLIWWIRISAVHSVTCPLPRQWWLTHIIKAKSMPKG